MTTETDDDTVKAYIIVNKGAQELYNVDSLDEVARICCNERPQNEVRDDIRWSLKRTGRWDREDGVIIVILATQPE